MIATMPMTIMTIKINMTITRSAIKSPVPLTT